MCGIFGYVGSKNVIETTLGGLKLLEYRGYDSAGIAGIRDGKLLTRKEVGKVAALEEELRASSFGLDLAIAHTRWATHGKVSVQNAHPHSDERESMAIVHNGIIENYEELKKELMAKGEKFFSETDTEVILKLIGDLYKGDILEAVRTAVTRLRGSYALALIHRDFPDRIIAVAHESPLVIGIGDNEAFVSSDSHAFLAHTRKVVFLSDAEIAVVKRDKVEIFSSSNERINREAEELDINREDASKGSFAHYTLKEIYEQPQTIRNALLSRYSEEWGTAAFEELNFDVNELSHIEMILILACGTSWHAALIAAYMIESQANIPVRVEISSEFRYKNPVVSPNTYAIAISQSGETADTIAAMRELRAKGVKILGICNVYGSTLAREADHTIFLKAGPEIGVCSTKAFTSQIVVLALLSLMLARQRHMSKDQGIEFIRALKLLPEQTQKVLDNSASIRQIAEKYALFDNFFFLGRQFMYPAALEGALKLKEISYVNANGYPAGEMKHGPIALISEDCPTVAFLGNKKTYEKILSNLMEVKARRGRIIAIAEEGMREVKDVADDIIWVPKAIDELAVAPAAIAGQLFAYYVALKRGENIDQPRNLAKSVTVE